MRAAELNQTLSEIENNKHQIETTLAELKSSFSSAWQQLNEHRKSWIEGKTQSIGSDPLAVVAEFFILGFYTGTCIRALKAGALKQAAEETKEIAC